MYEMYSVRSAARGSLEGKLESDHTQKVNNFINFGLALTNDGMGKLAKPAEPLDRSGWKIHQSTTSTVQDMLVSLTTWLFCHSEDTNA